MKRIMFLLLVALFPLGIVGCGSGGGADDVTVATGSGAGGAANGSLIFNFVQAQTTTVPVGTTQLRFFFLGSNDVVLSSETRDFAAQIVFENVSSDVLRVEVTALNNNGLPIASANGSVTVVPNSEQVVTLNIQTVSLQSLVVSPNPINLMATETAQLSIQGVFSDGSIANLDASAAGYTGNNAAVATVNASGLVTGVGGGNTTVTVTFTDPGTSNLVSSAPVPITVPASAVNLTGANTFNTDTGALNGNVDSGWDGTTLTVSSFDLQTGATLSVSGSQAFRLASLGNINIAGTVDASGGDGGVGACSGGNPAVNGVGGTAGAGGFPGGNGGQAGALNGQNGQGPGAGIGGAQASSGGSGAGHAAAGGNGENTAGGPSYASIPTTLLGGSGGGGGGGQNDGSPASDDFGGGGGGGGGAVRMTAQGTITVTASGVIDCSGGNGGNGSCTNYSAHGGGGSGGAIELLASVAPTVNGVLNVSGGAAGSGVNGASTAGAGSLGFTNVGGTLTP